MTETRSNIVEHPTQAGTRAVPLISASGLKPLFISAHQDLIGGVFQWRLWGRLGWLDIKRRYRRTVIGPFWSVISMFIFVMVLGAVGSGLLSKNTQEYLPFLVAGMVVWTLLSSIIQESSAVFLSGAGLLRQMRFDYTVLVYAMLWRNLIVFFHNMIVYVVIFAIFQPHKITPLIVMAVPGVAVLLLNGAWIAILLGMLTSRFRDIQYVIQTVLQIAMFITPLFWPPESLHGIRRILFVELNPLYHLLSIARDPLLGNMPQASNYIAVVAITVLGWGFTLFVFQRFRKRLSYWL